VEQAPNKTPAQQINDLIALVQSFNLKAATATSLIVKLQDAGNLLSKGNTQGACAKLQDFINLVNAQAAKRQITSGQAAQLICNATRIRAVLGCK
jgi:FIMAH domain